MRRQITAEPRYVSTAGGTRIRLFSRAEFLHRRWGYKAGEHVAFIAPTQNGKTTLAFQLLKYTATPRLPVTVLVMKPRDPVPAAWSRDLGLLEVPSWPPPKRMPWQEKLPGYTLWPPHSFQVKADNARMSVEFEKAIRDAYRRGNTILFADEVYGLVAELDGLTDDLIALWTRGGGMGTGLWTATQRPAGSQGHGIPGHMYSNATHLFFSFDPDAVSRRRYGEIGGTDPRLINDAVLALRRYQFLYLRKADSRGGPYLSVIDSE